MKLGLIVICYNSELEINEDLSKSILRLRGKFELCFVNNGSHDSTLKKLMELKDLDNLNLNILDIKKYKSKTMAIKAASRFLLSQKKLKYIGYISLKDFISKRHICKIYDFFQVKKLDQQLENSKTQRKILENIFSVNQYFAKRKILNEFNEVI